jgi:quinol-cytochrome oxidoreductase complex cytochrome b subunit
MFDLTEAQLIKIVCVILFVTVPSIIAAIVDRLLRNVGRGALVRAFWTALGGMGFGGLLLAMAGPRPKADAFGILLGNVGAGLIFACFFVVIILGYVLKRRAARSA